MKKKILVRGPALTQSGYGEQARFALRSLRTREDVFDIYLHPLNWGKTGWVFEDTEERRWLDSLIKKAAEYENAGGQYDMSLQVTIPNEWEKIAPINIGYTAGIETTRISPQWVEKSALMDRIIVVSNHAKYGFDKTSYQAKNEKTGEIVNDFKCQVPVETVNYAVRNLPAKKVDLDLQYDFNFLVVAQWSPRKNIENTIAWFVQEFMNDEVGLVLKANQMNNSNIDKHHVKKSLQSLLSNFPNRKCKIYLLHGDILSEEMMGLYEHPKIKAFINIAHGEGFGLPIFEAAQKGLPVVAPSWGGQVDFLYKMVKEKRKNKKDKIRNKAHFAAVEYVLKTVPKEVVWDGVLVEDSMWCEPHEGDYKSKLRDVYKNAGKYNRMATNLKKHLEKEFSEEKQYKKFVDICLSSCGHIDDKEVEDLFDQMAAG